MDDAIDRRRRGIDTGRRGQLVFGRQVRSWNPDLTSTSGALHDGAVDEIVMAEERTRLVHAALRDQPPDPRAADDEVFVAHGIDLLRAEPVARAERSKGAEVA